MIDDGDQAACLADPFHVDVHLDVFLVTSAGQVRFADHLLILLKVDEGSS